LSIGRTGFGSVLDQLRCLSDRHQWLFQDRGFEIGRPGAEPLEHGASGFSSTAPAGDWFPDREYGIRAARAISTTLPSCCGPSGNIAEEIESVGSEQRHAVESLLVQALIHRLTAAAWPLALAVPHWEAEARVFRGDARRRFVPSMRQRLDLAALYH
jgi:hypothetical protein